MKHSLIILSVFSFILLNSCLESENEYNWLTQAVNTASYQMKHAADFYTPGQNPRSLFPDGIIRYANSADWTSGFFPGSLWHMYEITNDTFFRNKAILFTEALDTVKYFTYTHDLGFMLNCSFGNGFKHTAEQAYKDVLLQGAESLATRFNPLTGSIRSWDFGDWQFPVIVDNMMNLELLLWADGFTEGNYFKNLATSHALQTIKNHYRSDFSCYHVVSYDTITGNVETKDTHQGYSIESSWARGQAWGLYGFTMMYDYTGDSTFLYQAKNIAEYLMNHPRMPEDGIPYWDFDAPDIPNAMRDASAAVIIACSLIELSANFEDSGEKYFNFAEKILKNLCQDAYLSLTGENGYFILQHSVGGYPLNSEIDTPINYADYYFLEAIIKYCDRKKIDLNNLRS